MSSADRIAELSRLLRTNQISRASLTWDEAEAIQDLWVEEYLKKKERK